MYYNACFRQKYRAACQEPDTNNPSKAGSPVQCPGQNLSSGISYAGTLIIRAMISMVSSP